MHISDSSLIKKIQKGDKSAFEQLFKSHYAPLCDYAHRYIKNPHTAEDQVQEVFVKIWEIRKDWNPKGTIKAYLYTAVRNQSLNYLKHQKVIDQWKKEERKASRNTSNPLPSSEYEVNLKKLKKQVQEAIQQLPEKRREVFELSRNHGLTYKEIAKSLGISVKTVETQMSRSLRHLRNRLQQELK